MSTLAVRYPRHLEPRLWEALSDTPVVLVAGPRQAGKTTLVRQVADSQGWRYLSLDDELTLLAARQDPVGLVRSLEHAVIDEIQRAPQLLLAIKKSVDDDRRPGRFLLTGSANLMTLSTKQAPGRPKLASPPRGAGRAQPDPGGAFLADSLAGRMETLTLLPLSQSEIEGSAANWIDAAFAGRLPSQGTATLGEALVRRVLRGGYPEAVARPLPRRRVAWARDYIDALVQRDVRDIAGVEKLEQMPRLLRALAQTAGQMCNYTQLGGQIGLDSKTAARYVGVFEQMFLLSRVESWHRNRLSRVVKSPKLQFVDAGLLAALLDLGEETAVVDRTRFGNVLETFVFSELLKHASVSERSCRLMHYRDADRFEVDVVIEDPAGRVVGVEVKAAATVREGDLRGLRKLSTLAGDAFAMGVVLHDGTETLPLGDRLWAAPLASLWWS